MSGQIGVARGSGGGEADDGIFFDGHNGAQLRRVGVGKVVMRGAVFRAKLIEIFGGKKLAVGLLPGANVNCGDGEGIVGHGEADVHGGSIA